MILLSGCATASPHALTARTETHGDIYRLVDWSSAFRIREEVIAPSHRLSDLPVTYTVSDLTPQAILLTIGPAYGMPTHGWNPGLYAIDAQTGRVLASVPVSLAWSVNSAAVGPDSVIYATTGASRRLAPRIQVFNWVRHSHDILWEVPRRQRLLSPITDVAVVGHMAYWTANLATPQGVVSRLYRGNLETGRVAVLWESYPKITGLMCFTMTSTPTGLWLSIGNLNSSNEPISALWFWSLTQERVTERVALWHAPTLLYGATPEGAVFSANVYGPASAHAESPPYPVYLANVKTHQLDQLTSPVQPGDQVTVDGSTVAVSGLGLSSELVNVATFRAATVSVPFSLVGGGWLVEHKAHELLWVPLTSP